MTLPRSVLALALTLGAVGAAACSTTPVVNATYNFDRATDVEFVCLGVPDLASSPAIVHPLGDCQLADADNSAVGDPSVHLHALVTQSERGEVAVVDLATTTGVPLIDNSQAIPGFTFLPVGRFPTAIVADTRAGLDPSTPVGMAPSTVWVASGQDQNLQRLDPRLIRQDARDARNMVGGNVPVMGSPRDLAIDTVAGRRLLYVALPDLGGVQVLDVTDPMAPANRGLIVLTSPAPGSGGGGGGGGGDAGIDGGSSDGGLDGATGTIPAHPVALAVAPEASPDPNAHRVYVADDASPWVHVLDGATLTEVARLNVGVPSRGLAVLPRVRAVPECAVTDPDHCAAARYLYVISGNEGGVYAYDLDRNAVVQANRLPVASGGAPDAGNRRFDPTLGSDLRLPLPSPAAALAPIVTLDAIANPPNVPCSAATATSCPSTVGAGPGQLHGVFVGVAMRDGNFTVVDIDDYDAQCRLNNCNSAGLAERCYFRQARHTPRAGVSFDHPPRVANPPVLTAAVQITTANQTVTRSGVAAGLATPVVACTSQRTVANEACDPVSSTNPMNSLSNFGVELTPRVDLITDSTCTGQSDADVYALHNETWSITYEGVLPGLDLAGGQFVASGSNGLTLQVPGAGFCNRGTLGNGLEVITIIDDPSPLDAHDADLCGTYFGGGAGPYNRDFVVSAARQDGLDLTVPVFPPTDPSAGLDATAVGRCYPQATHFQVRARGQWIVTGSREGFLHAVVPDAAGRCVTDPVAQAASDALSMQCLSARVVMGPGMRQFVSCPAARVCTAPFVNGRYSAASTPVFANRYFCMQIYPGIQNAGAMPAPAPLARDLQFAFAVTGAYDPLVFSTGMLPASARFLTTTGRLYVVDTSTSGLVEYRSDPLTRTRLFN